MKTAQFNNIYFYFFCSQLIFLPIYFYHTPLISDAINTDKAIWMHLIGIAWSAIGYFTARFASTLQERQQEDQARDKQYSFSYAFYVCSYLLIIVGITVNILQVFLFIPPMEYLSKIFSSDFDMGLRNAYLLSSDEGGIPGIVKMFSYAPLSMYLMSLGLLNFIDVSEVDQRRLTNLSRVSLIAVFIKVFFSLDRLTIMAVILAIIFLGFRKGYAKNIRYWILIIFGLFLAEYLSSKRLEASGIIDFTLLYFKMGLVNFELMIETLSGYAYGFSTFLAPLPFILKFFYLPSPNFETNFEWDWNPTQYFSSYAFQDFGYYYFVLFYIVGIVLYVFDFKALKRKSIYSSSIYFVVLYGTVSFVFVPAIRGIDFWFALLVPCVMINRFATSDEHAVA